MYSMYAAELRLMNAFGQFSWKSHSNC